MANYTYKDGRIWIQLGKFQPYKLLLPYGMSDLGVPKGTLNPIREPAPNARRQSVIVDTLRSEPGLISFNIQTRLQTTLNYMLGMQDKRPNIQVHMGACGRPDTYTASAVGITLDRCAAGDLGIDRVALIQGDDSPVNIQMPWSAEDIAYVDFGVSFLSARTIAENENLLFAAFITDECGEGINPGTYGYVGGVASLYGAVVWRTNDKGQSFTNVGLPFAVSEDISDGIVIGEPYRHRLIVSRGTTDGSNPAEIAYADVDSDQTVTFVNVDVGVVDGEYITALYGLNWGNIYAVTDSGNVYKSADGGASWTLLTSNAGIELYSISAISNGTVLVVGYPDFAILSHDFGVTWTELSGITGTFSACHVTPDGTMFVADNVGLVLHGSYDNGVTWHTLPLQGVTPTSINAIKSVDNNVVWVAVDTGSGGRVLRSTDGGAGFYLWSLDVPSNGNVADVYCVDENFVWIVGDDGFVTLTNSQFIGL